jgi:glycosyltransferase involved in cell wall biosynthesis
MPSTPSVLAFTPRGHPVFSPWREALGARVPLDAVWGGDGADLRRHFLRLAPPDFAPPRLIPLAPWGAPWRPWHQRWLRRQWPQLRTVVFTRPDQAALLPAFGDVRRIYYVIDDYATYRRDWHGAEATLLAAADRVVCVSQGLAGALARRAAAVAEKTTVLPNAIPASWLPPAPPTRPSPLPENLALLRPLAGVLGRISSRLRLDWLLAAMDATPGLHWVFVGDIEWGEVVESDRPLLAQLRRHPRTTWLGARPFAALRDFAAALDVAILPYSDRSTNPHGSAVRLFLHLPFAAPLLATPGCAQVGEFSPLVTVCDSSAALNAALTNTSASNFDDSRRPERWRVAQDHTWEARATAWLPLLDS